MGMNASNKIATFFKYFVLILVGIIMIYPLLWMISATFKDNSEIFAGIGLWIKNPTLDGYRNALNNFGGSINILQAMLNTYSYVLPKVICTVVSACVAAYGFGRFDFPGRKLLFNIMLATLFLPQVVLNVPQYLLYNKFGWLDSPFYLAIWVHCAFATETYFVYQLIQFMRNVPRDLDEAAACINQVRARAYAVDASQTDAYPAVKAESQEQMRKAVRIERRMEFAMENTRLQDLMRWKLAAKALNGYNYIMLQPTELLNNVVNKGLWFWGMTPQIDEDGLADFSALFNAGYCTTGTKRTFTDREYLWPIPTHDMELNPNLTNNPGY